MADMHTKDLTTGSPMKLILSFMLPLVFGLLFQQVYSMVDTIVVGKFLGVDALAGVGSTGSYYVSGAGAVQRRVRRVRHSRGAEIRTAGF